MFPDPINPTNNKFQDSFKRELVDLRLSVTDKCNFRCPYCMPAEVYHENFEYFKKEELLNYDEMFSIAEAFVRIGVKKIRITGGEPLIRTQLETLIERIAGIEGLEDLALTTNGMLLADKAQVLKDSGLNRVTVSLDSCDADIFKKLSGKNVDVDQVLKGIETARNVGFDSVKINYVVQKDVNVDCILPVIEMYKGTGVVVRFIEFMDVGNINGWELEKVFTADQIFEIVNAKYPIEAVAPTYKGEVAKRFKFKDGSGEIGIIASVSKPFCGDCTRARLSVDGKLYTCLFASEGFDLKTIVRKGLDSDALVNEIKSIWTKRKDQYSELRSQMKIDPDAARKIEMYRIGG